MATATTTATAAGFTSSLSGLPDQVLLAHTRSLVRHEQALQLAVLDHLREIQTRHLHLRLGFSSLFDYAVRELGYSEGAAWRRIKAMRPCSETAGTRERLLDRSLTLSAAALLQNTFDLQQRTASATVDRGSAPATPELLPGATGTAPEAGAMGAEAAAPARPVPVLDAAQRQELVAQASGKSTREVKQLLAGVVPELARPAERMRGAGREPLGAEGGGRRCLSARHRAATGTAVARGPAPVGGAARGAAGAGRPAALRPGATAARARRGAPGGKRGPGAGAEGAGRAGGWGHFASEAGRARATGSTADAGGHERRWQHPGAGNAVRRGVRAWDWRHRHLGGGSAARAAGGGAETCGGSTPVRARPVAVAPGIATSAAGRRSHATVPTRRPTRPADQCMPTALAVADRGRSAPSPAKRTGVAQFDGHSGPAPEAAYPSRGSAQPPHRAPRSRYIPAPVRRAVWLRDGGCCSYVDPHSGRRCESRFLLELDHIVPFALAHL